jgi:hypothetical protein
LILQIFLCCFYRLTLPCIQYRFLLSWAQEE